MVRRLAGGAALSLLVAAHAVAAPIVDDGPLDGTVMHREIVPPTEVARARSRMIYLNRQGTTVRPGDNNSSAGTSSIVTTPVEIGSWEVSAAKWTATVACMRETWSRFDVEITETDPGSAPHIEALFGGSAADIGRPLNVAGLAPFASDCGVIEGAIVFAFTDNLPSDPQLVCEVMSQEIGHAYGLDHELLAADPMSYLPFTGKRTFQDTAAQCGEKTARPCGLAAPACRAEQSSVQILLARLGAAGGDGTAPTVVITDPAAHASVEPGFVVRARATDDVALTSVALYVDGVKIESMATGPFEFATDSALAYGAHTIMIEARDGNENITVSEVDVTVTRDPPWFASCSAGGSPGLGVCAALLVLRRRRRYRRISI
ncbi:hypothetical protein BH11MYX3_BH11MYX3_23080 [soil metagenome]